MLDMRLYMAQRITALLMAPLVLGHLAVMIYAVQGGLSAAEILGSTQGSILWFLFYGTFVVAVAIHALYLRKNQDNLFSGFLCIHLGNKAPTQDQHPP